MGWHNCVEGSICTDKEQSCSFRQVCLQAYIDVGDRHNATWAECNCVFSTTKVLQFGDFPIDGGLGKTFGCEDRNGSARMVQIPVG